jgi:hypothetical protein
MIFLTDLIFVELLEMRTSSRLGYAYATWGDSNSSAREVTGFQCLKAFKCAAHMNSLTLVLEKTTQACRCRSTPLLEPFEPIEPMIS